MAYTTGTFENWFSQIDGVFKMHRYLTTDAIATVLGASYITDALAHRLSVGDLVLVVNQTTPLLYVCQVSSITASNATLIMAATVSGAFTNIVATGTLAVTGNTTLSGTVNTTGATSIGSATSTVVGFYGGAGSSQRSSSNQTSSNAAVSSSFGASQLAILQEIMNTLAATGLWKAS